MASMIAASEQLETDQLDNFVIVGELALTGAHDIVHLLRQRDIGIQISHCGVACSACEEVCRSTPPRIADT